MRFVAVLTLLAYFLVPKIFAQEENAESFVLSPQVQSQLVGQAADWVAERYVFEAKGREIGSHLRKELADKKVFPAPKPRVLCKAINPGAKGHQ